MQNQGSIAAWCFNKELHITTVFLFLFYFFRSERNAATGNPSRKDAVAQLELHLNS
jgi:hypothetical protein